MDHFTSIERHAYTAVLVSGVMVIDAAFDTKTPYSKRHFRTGLGSTMIAAATMALIEYSTQKYLHTDLFSTSLPYQSLKIGFAACAAVGFSLWRGIYREIAKNKNVACPYIAGLLYGGLLLSPFCTSR